MAQFVYLDRRMYDRAKVTLTYSGFLGSGVDLV